MEGVCTCWISKGLICLNVVGRGPNLFGREEQADSCAALVALIPFLVLRESNGLLGMNRKGIC